MVGVYANSLGEGMFLTAVDEIIDEEDDKIIAVHYDDPEYRDYRDISELPEHRLKAVKRFFEDYKALENKQVKVEKFMGRFDALNIIEQSIKLYADMKPQLIEKYAL